MAQTNYTPIQLYNSLTATNTPTTLAQGEVGVNITDKKLWIGNGTSNIQLLGAGADMSLNSITLSGGTANGVGYLNASKVLTTGSALTFDGTTSLAIRQVTGGTGNYSEFVLDVANSFSGTSKSYLRNISLNGGNSSTALAFGVNADGGGAPSEQMRLTSTGLGIGTSSPAVKLDVVGDAQFLRTVGYGGSANSFISLGGTDNGYVNNGAASAWRQYVSGNEYGQSLRFDAFLRGTGWTNRMLLDSPGNLGLGVTPSAWSSIKAFQTGTAASFSGGSGFNDAFIASNAYYDGTNWKYINTNTAYYASVGGSAAARWYTAPSGTAGNAITFTQAMTLDASGNLLLGTTSQISASTRSTLSFNNASARCIDIVHTSNSYNGSALQFWNASNTSVGSIFCNATTTTYNITSDQRLKENIVDSPEFGSVIDSMKVRSYAWKANGNHQRAGFIAQELVAVAPEAVHQPADPEEMMAVDYSKLVPMLVKEIQSLRKRLAAAGI